MTKVRDVIIVHIISVDAQTNRCGKHTEILGPEVCGRLVNMLRSLGLDITLLRKPRATFQLLVHFPDSRERVLNIECCW